MHRIAMAVGFCLLVGCAAKPAPPRAASPEPTHSRITEVTTQEQLESRSAPEGYSWVDCGDGMHCRFLRPDGWFVHQETNDRTHALFITQESFTPPDGRFHVGLSVNVVRDVPARLGVSPQGFMEKMLAGYQARAVSSGEIRTDQLMEGIRTGYISATLAGPPGGENVALQAQVVANERTGTVYVLLFEAPADQWNAAWVHGRTIFDQMAMSPDE